MATMYRVAAVMILSPFVFSQDAQQTELAVASKSPFQLARYLESHKIVDWGALRSSLGTRDPLGIGDPPSLYVPCGEAPENPCSTQVVTVLNPDQEILIIQGNLVRRNDVYLRYLRKTNGEWQFAGERRAWVNEYPRRHEVMRLDGKPFLKISRDRSQAGGALMQEVEDWFDLTQPGFDPVFSFTAQGSCEPFSFAVGHTVRAQAIGRQASGLETIDLILNIHFDGPGLDMAATYVGVYDRSSGEKKFSLRRACSGLNRSAAIPTEDFEGLGGVDFDKLSNQRLLFYAFSGLQKIASGSDENAREWLRIVLSHSDDTREKRTLSELLGKR
jgi:hypothetical protein